MDRQLIDVYVAGAEKFREAVAGLSPRELTTRIAPGTWSIQEVAIHLVDSDAISIDRMKRIVIEENPPLLYADENSYIERLFPHEQNLDDALTLFKLGRRQWGRVLKKLPDETFSLKGTHNRRGELTLGQLVED